MGIFLFPTKAQRAQRVSRKGAKELRRKAVKSSKWGYGGLVAVGSVGDFFCFPRKHKGAQSASPTYPSPKGEGRSIPFLLMIIVKEKQMSFSSEASQIIFSTLPSPVGEGPGMRRYPP